MQAAVIVNILIIKGHMCTLYAADVELAHLCPSIGAESGTIKACVLNYIKCIYYGEVDTYISRPSCCE